MKILKRFIGISIGGGKSDTTCLSVLDYYPQQHKLFLVKLYDRIHSDPDETADSKIIELIKKYTKSSPDHHIEYIAFDVPYEFPLCVTCQLKCPGYESCKEPHIQWMWSQNQKKQKTKKQKKIFTPYTQKSIELYLELELEEVFHRSDALGSNLAPLTMRANFLIKQIQEPLIEVYPRLSFWRMGRDLKIMKRHLRNHRNSLGGEESRQVFLKEIVDHRLIFIYQQDHKLMIDNPAAFDAFLCSFTGFLKFKNLTEPRVKGFPSKETWVEFPKSEIHLIKLLS